jgi:hypothetical protein
MPVSRRHTVCTQTERPLPGGCFTLKKIRREAPIRTLSVSLVAVAAIAAGLLLTRDREDGGLATVTPGGSDNPAGRLKLDALRAAGL